MSDLPGSRLSEQHTTHHYYHWIPLLRPPPTMHLSKTVTKTILSGIQPTGTPHLGKSPQPTSDKQPTPPQSPAMAMPAPTVAPFLTPTLFSLPPLPTHTTRQLPRCPSFLGRHPRHDHHQNLVLGGRFARHHRRPRPRSTAAGHFRGHGHLAGLWIGSTTHYPVSTILRA